MIAYYGIGCLGNDFFVHITTNFIFLSTLIRINELNLR